VPAIQQTQKLEGMKKVVPMRYFPAALIVLCFSLAARAQSPEFGRQGQISPSGSVSFSYLSISPPTGSSSSFKLFTLAPGVLYFVVDNFAVGGFVQFSYFSGVSGSSNTFFGIGPTAGYNIPLASRISLFPQLGLVFRDLSTSSGGSSPSTTSTTFGLQITAPFLYQIATHFLLGFGPTFSTELVSKISFGSTSGDSDKTTAFGVQSVITGFF
jgi:hypothetical protein